jgi:hypothetical protein
MIANNAEQLEVLFSLDKHLDTSTSDQVWDLISSLKTNKAIYMNVLTNDKETLAALSKPDGLKQMPIHKLLYLLQIVKYLVSRIILHGEQAESADEVALYFEKPVAAAGDNEDIPGMEEKEGQGQG